MSFRTEFDEWPWRGHKQQGREDARNGRKNIELYDHYDGEHKKAYANEFDRETREIREEQWQEEERYEHKERLARQHREEEAYQRQYEEDLIQREYTKRHKKMKKSN